MTSVSRAARLLVLATLGLAQATALVPMAASAQTAVRAAAVPTEPLTIATQGGHRRFAVEVMRDDASRARGLMFRRHMAPDHGMLFDFERVEPVTMWMKNTYLPLDMVFIRPDGTVSRVAADAMVREVEVWSVRVAGWSTAAAQAVAALAEVLAVPDRAFDGAALLVSLPQSGRIDQVTAALVEASASVRASTLVGSHASRYRLEGAGLEHPAKHSSGA